MKLKMPSPQTELHGGTNPLRAVSLDMQASLVMTKNYIMMKKISHALSSMTDTYKYLSIRYQHSKFGT